MAAIADEVCSKLPQIRHRILLDDHAALYNGADSGVLPPTAPEDICQIQYTSGTTGFPKGALLHHWGLLKNGHDSVTRAGVRAGDSFVHHMPLFHTTGCAILVLGGFGLGATQLLAPVFDPDMIVRVIERETPALHAGRADNDRRVDRCGRKKRPRRLLDRTHHVRRVDGSAGARQEGASASSAPRSRSSTARPRPRRSSPRRATTTPSTTSAAPSASRLQDVEVSIRDVATNEGLRCRRAGRDLRARLPHHARATTTIPMRPQRRSTRKAGCTPAISAAWMRAAS